MPRGRSYTAYDAAMEEAVNLYGALDTFCDDLLSHLSHGTQRTQAYESPAGDIRITQAHSSRKPRTIHYNGWKHTIGEPESIKRAASPLDAVESIAGVETALKTWWGSTVTDEPVPRTDFQGAVLRALSMMSDDTGKQANIGDVYHDILGDQADPALTLYLGMDTPISADETVGELFQDGLDEPVYADEELLVARPRRHSGDRAVAVRDISGGRFSVHPIEARTVQSNEDVRREIGFDVTYGEVADSRIPFRRTHLNEEENPTVLVADGVALKLLSRASPADSAGTQTQEASFSEDASIQFEKPVILNTAADYPYFVTSDKMRATCSSKHGRQNIRLQRNRRYACWCPEGVY